MSVAFPLQTLEALSNIKEPEEWAAWVRRKMGNAMPELSLNNVLCAVYISHQNIREIKRPDGTIVPLIKTSDAVKEDIYQGKVCLVLEVGALAFEDDDHFRFAGFRCKPGDWVSFAMHNCQQKEYMGIPCRVVQDRFITEKLKDPRHITS